MPGDRPRQRSSKNPTVPIRGPGSIARPGRRSFRYRSHIFPANPPLSRRTTGKRWRWETGSRRGFGSGSPLPSPPGEEESKTSRRSGKACKTLSWLIPPLLPHKTGFLQLLHKARIDKLLGPAPFGLGISVRDHRQGGLHALERKGRILFDVLRGEEIVGFAENLLILSPRVFAERLDPELLVRHEPTRPLHIGLQKPEDYVPVRLHVGAAHGYGHIGKLDIDIGHIQKSPHSQFFRLKGGRIGDDTRLDFLPRQGDHHT